MNRNRRQDRGPDPPLPKDRRVEKAPATVSNRTASLSARRRAIITVLTLTVSIFPAVPAGVSRVKAGKPPDAETPATTEPAPGTSPVPDPKQVGGEPDGVVQVANLVYAGVKSSQCFADHFLVRAEQETAISTSRRFHAVKLSSVEIFDYPLLIMTGEGSFRLTDAERENLRSYLERGGFLLASAGCSSQEWDRCFRREIAKIFPDHRLSELGMDHAVFHTVRDIQELKAAHGKPRPLEGIHLGGRLALLYSRDGLNDTAHTQGCCCCGGNEITNAVDINVNVLAYCLAY